MVLFSISVSGLFSSDDILYDAPLSFLTPNLTSDWTYIHNILHYFLYILIGIHILAILYYQIVKKMKIIERVLDEISFTATDRSGEKIVVDSNYIKKNLGELVKDTDLSKFIL